MLLIELRFVFVFVFGPKGMVEVVAENYHNIWAKKKKSDLGSRGGFLIKNKVVEFTLLSLEVT